MRILASVVVMFTAAGLLSAQEGAGWVALHGGTVNQSSDSPFKASSTLGIGLGGWFNRWFGAEVSFLNSKLELKATGQKGDETQGMVSGLLCLNPGGTTFFPFVRLGLGIADYKGDLREALPANENDRRATYHAGLGIQSRLGNHFILGLEARGIQVGKDDPKRKETMGLLSFGYRWGGNARVGKASPSQAEPPILQAPMVEAQPSLPEQPAIEAQPQRPQGPMVEELPTTP